MSENASLWTIPSEDEPMDSTSRVVELMREQCRYLEAETEGAVRARFDRVADAPQWAAAISALAAASSRAMNSASIIDNLKDTSSLCRKEAYDLRIYNDEHHFRILELILTPLYPVTIWFDDDVLDDLRSEITVIAGESDSHGRFQISNDDQLMECFQAAVGGKRFSTSSGRYSRMEEIPRRKRNRHS